MSEHRYFILKAEIENDPEALGYATRNALQVAQALNRVDRPAPDLTTLRSEAIYEAIVRADYLGLTPEAREELRLILSLGPAINVAQGTKARAALLSMFQGTPTATALQGLVEGQLQARWQEIGLPGPVRTGHVQDARRVRS